VAGISKPQAPCQPLHAACVEAVNYLPTLRCLPQTCSACRIFAIAGIFSIHSLHQPARQTRQSFAFPARKESAGPVPGLRHVRRPAITPARARQHYLFPDRHPARPAITLKRELRYLGYNYLLGKDRQHF
jgi:hypothetical protein